MDWCWCNVGVFGIWMICKTMRLEETHLEREMREREIGRNRGETK